MPACPFAMLRHARRSYTIACRGRLPLDGIEQILAGAKGPAGVLLCHFDFVLSGSQLRRSSRRTACPSTMSCSCSCRWPALRGPASALRAVLFRQTTRAQGVARLGPGKPPPNSPLATRSLHRGSPSRLSGGLDFVTALLLLPTSMQPGARHVTVKRSSPESRPTHRSGRTRRQAGPPVPALECGSRRPGRARAASSRGTASPTAPRTPGCGRGAISSGLGHLRGRDPSPSR